MSENEINQPIPTNEPDPFNQPAPRPESVLKSTPGTIAHILNELRKTIVGQDEVIEQILVAVLAEGHALLEGVPGTAKTLTVKTLAAMIGAQFSRIQFTPDLMPSDITGTNVFNMQTSQFCTAPGADLYGHPAGGRDQPYAAEDPGRTARGDGRAPDDYRRRTLSALAALYGARHREPDRV